MTKEPRWPAWIPRANFLIGTTTHSTKNGKWQVKVVAIEQELNRSRDGTEQIIEGLDRALALLICAPRPGERLDTRHQLRLLQILLRHTVIDTQGQIIELGSNPPFVCLTWLHEATLPHNPPNGEERVEETLGSRQLFLTAGFRSAAS
jgi:hypothetical protein